MAFVQLLTGEFCMFYRNHYLNVSLQFNKVVQQFHAFNSLIV